MLPEVAVATGITSNWLITDDTGMRMETVSGGTIVMEFGTLWLLWSTQKGQNCCLYNNNYYYDLYNNIMGKLNYHGMI